MCTIDDWDRRDGLMSDSLFKRIVDEIKGHPEVKRVHLYRDGEPLLDKKMPQRIKMMKDAGVKEVGISTNVALLNPKTSIAILEAGLDSIILSIDSLKKYVYEAIRLKLNYEEVMINALRFIDLRNTGGYKTKIWVRMIRQDSNYGEWPAYEAYWRKALNQTDRVDFKLLHNWGGQLKVNQISTDTKPCVALWSLMCIFSNGDVPMCNVDYNLKHPLGNVNLQSIESLWRSQTQKLRQQTHLTDRGQIQMCKNCTVWEEHDTLTSVKPSSIMA
jgi:radical SAM protein with 4Fe4S-binding SPASM domain